MTRTQRHAPPAPGHIRPGSWRAAHRWGGALVLALGALAGTSAGATAALKADFGPVRATRAAVQLADGVVRSADNQGAPFIVLDKVAARVFVFDGRGRLQAHAPALLGLARGDDTVPGIGDKPLAQIAPHERTTPAGRFVAELGTSSSRGEDVVWVDYDAAVSMHRVITTNPRERRLQRLATPTPRDNRISYGCVNLPRSFYETWIGPTVARGRTVIYVLPETRPAQAVFPFLQDATPVAGAAPRAKRPARVTRSGPPGGPMPLIDQ